MKRRPLRDSDSYAFWRWQEITPESGPYMRRLFIVRCPLFQVSLHWFKAPDPGRDLHDHPRDFISFILRGAYVEESPSQTANLWSQTPGGHPTMNLTSRSFWRGAVIKKRAEDLHRIAMVAPGTLTLVFWGRRRRAWGFQTSQGWVNWRTYTGAGQTVRPEDV